MAEAYGWLLDPKKCIECRACEAACKEWYDVETGINVRYRRVRVKESGVFPMVQQQAVTMACNHCEKALCVKVCPVKAITRREDGIVMLDREKCVGCRQCYMFCPYGAPQFNKNTGKMEKCVMCADRVDGGAQPACATLCPTGALVWGKWGEIGTQGSADFAGMPTPKTTVPRLRFITEGFVR